MAYLKNIRNGLRAGGWYLQNKTTPDSSRFSTTTLPIADFNAGQRASTSTLADRVRTDIISPSYDIVGSNYTVPVTSNEKFKAEIKNLLSEDINNFYPEIRDILKAHISHPELYNIATYYFQGREERIFISAVQLLMAKAINTHLFGNSKILPQQRKVLMLTDMLLTILYLHDDVVDSPETRFGQPAVSKLYQHRKPAAAGSAIHAVALMEAAKLGLDDVTISLNAGMRATNQGQLMQLDQVKDSETLSHYINRSKFKTGYPYGYACLAAVQAVTTDTEFHEAIYRYGCNFGFATQILDDLNDTHQDLMDGEISLLAILAAKEYPEMKPMMRRNFRKFGDVERALQLIAQSQALNEAQEMMRDICITGIKQLDKIVNSPYKTILEKIMIYYVYRANSLHETMHEVFHMFE